MSLAPRHCHSQALAVVPYLRVVEMSHRQGYVLSPMGIVPDLLLDFTYLNRVSETTPLPQRLSQS